MNKEYLQGLLEGAEILVNALVLALGSTTGSTVSDLDFRFQLRVHIQDIIASYRDQPGWSAEPRPHGIIDTLSKFEQNLV